MVRSEALREAPPVILVRISNERGCGRGSAKCRENSRLRGTFFLLFASGAPGTGLSAVIPRPKKRAGRMDGQREEWPPL